MPHPAVTQELHMQWAALKLGGNTPGEVAHVHNSILPISLARIHPTCGLRYTSVIWEHHKIARLPITFPQWPRFGGLGKKLLGLRTDGIAAPPVPKLNLPSCPNAKRMELRATAPGGVARHCIVVAT